MRNACIISESGSLYNILKLPFARETDTFHDVNVSNYLQPNAVFRFVRVYRLLLQEQYSQVSMNSLAVGTFLNTLRLRVVETYILSYYSIQSCTRVYVINLIPIHDCASKCSRSFLFRLRNHYDCKIYNMYNLFNRTAVHRNH